MKTFVWDIGSKHANGSKVTVTVTAPNKEEAKKIAIKLLQPKLAAYEARTTYLDKEIREPGAKQLPLF